VYKAGAFLYTMYRKNSKSETGKWKQV